MPLIGHPDADANLGGSRSWGQAVESDLRRPTAFDPDLLRSVRTEAGVYLIIAGRDRETRLTITVRLVGPRAVSLSHHGHVDVWLRYVIEYRPDAAGPRQRDRDNDGPGFERVIIAASAREEQNKQAVRRGLSKKPHALKYALSDGD
ncbi:hypothetical protein ISU10_21215 [Nocardioides agariphilus]|uniref:Uncharacterized protein n=1 Tax=Nocardioides agariphilus TaxID=433664 RepID=A0A930VTB7_9ACTN|nr:hypothetical protein [Nocardioides agariphilus]MBF4770302.1 hypothetical protein [Nocardioides agariphilus]